MRYTTAVAGWCGLLLAAALSGCALKLPPGLDFLKREALPNVQTPGDWAGGGAASGSVQDNWLAGFADPQLDSLVQEALAYNPNLRVAAARIEQAAAYAKLAGATLYPQVNLLARGGGQMGGDPSGLQGVGIFANWEIDLWGRVRAEREAASSQHGGVSADAEYARQSLTAMVAKSWFLAVEAKLQKTTAEDMVRASEQLVSLTEDRLRVGRGDEYDLALARASYETYRDSVRQLDFALQQALRALEVLAGRYPAAAVTVPEKLAPIPGAVPAGMPSELLERRPDVIAAERRVAAAFYRTEEAKAARLPRIALTASATSVSSELFVLKERSNPVLSFGASLLVPLFTGGALQSQVEIRTAEQKQAVAEYGRIAANAFSEVESALSAGFTLEQREALLSSAAAHNERALALSVDRYRIGPGDLRAVQERQISVYAARTALLRVQTERLVQRINLHLALGGGFDRAPPEAAAATIGNSAPPAAAGK